ncbi:MAG: hypothetical protein ACK4MW_01655 [Aquificaceae bacterium]
MYGGRGWKAYEHGREKKITNEEVHNSNALKDLLKQVYANIECVACDGAYNTREVYVEYKEA